MADAYNRAIGNVSFRGLLDALSPTPIVGDAISGVLGLYDTGKGLLGDYKAAQEKDPRKMIRGMAANTDNYNSGLLNAASVLPYVTPAVAGMFIGKNSKVWDALKADEAQKMLAAGVDPKDVWKKTGTFKGVDGALRQEIPDNVVPSKIPLSMDNLLDYPKVGKAYPHKELYKAYPDLKDITLAPKTGDYRGAFVSGQNVIELTPVPQGSITNPTEHTARKSTALHELQHAIQEKEGWALGGNPRDMAKELYPYEQARSKFEEAAKQALTTNDEIARGNALQEMDYYGKILGKTPELKGLTVPFQPEEAYRRLAGEAEARLTQSRMNMTMPERLQVYPYDMLDVPQDQLIVRGEGGTPSMSISKAKENEIYSTLKDLISGNRSKTMVRDAIDLTDEQKNEIVSALSSARPDIPPYARSTLPFSVGHAYDSRMSGAKKPNGKNADKFALDDVMSWIKAAGDDSAAVMRNDGSPTLFSLYNDSGRGLMYPVEIPIAQDISGRIYGNGVIPRGVKK